MCRRRPALLGAFAFFLSTTASAVPPTYSFAGELSFSTPLLASVFEIGDEVAGSFTPATSVDSEIAGSLGTYSPGPAYTISVNDLIWASDGEPLGLVSVWNFSFDRFFASTTLSGPSVAGGAPGGWTFDLFDTSGATFSSDSLPSALRLEEFQTRNFFLTFIFPEAAELAAFRITSVQVTQVPEPSSLVLFAIGTMCVLVVANCRRRLARTP